MNINGRLSSTPSKLLTMESFNLPFTDVPTDGQLVSCWANRSKLTDLSGIVLTTGGIIGKQVIASQ